MKNFKINELVVGQITGVTKYGIFIKLDNNYTGMIHISEISNKFISDLEKLYVIGEEIEAKIIEIDDNKKQIKLTTKNINDLNKKRKSIKEFGKGFEPLKENLACWVEEKLSELEKISKTP